MDRIKIVRGLCMFLPPLISQKVRSWLISIKANRLKGNFKRKAINGGIFIGNFQDFHSFRFYIHGYFEWRNVILANKIQKIKKGDIVEVGANVGTETISFVEICGSNEVHAFEPVIDNFNYLQAINDENNFKNLRLYKFLVSDKSGKAYFQIPDSFNSGSGYITVKENEETIEYPVVTIDEELAAIKSCSLIAIDVEGYELNVLRGSKDIIARYKPYLIIEVNPQFLSQRANINVDILYEEINKMGYESFYIEKLKLEKVDIEAFSLKSNKNWLCVPKGDLKHTDFLSRSIFWNALNPFISYKIF